MTLWDRCQPPHCFSVLIDGLRRPSCLLSCIDVVPDSSTLPHGDSQHPTFSCSWIHLIWLLTYSTCLFCVERPRAIPRKPAPGLTMSMGCGNCIATLILLIWRLSSPIRPGTIRMPSVLISIRCPASAALLAGCERL